MQEAREAASRWVYGRSDEYCAWPSLERLRDGSLVLLFCRSEEHLGPTGSIMCMRSADGGASWAPPAAMRDTALDDRECGMTRLRDGRLLAHLHSTRHTRASYEALRPDSYRPEVLSRWIGHVERPEYRDAAAVEGSWVVVSDDGGRSWSAPRRGPDSVHGGVHLSSGPVLVAGYRRTGRIEIWEASPDALEWHELRTYAPPAVPGSALGEPHLVELGSGRLIMMTRSTAHPYDDGSERNVLWVTYSDDGGHTWAETRPTPLWGFPPHLLRLSDGRVLCSYGYRRPPYGQRACVSEDGLRWKLEDEVTLRADADNGDLGYPASAEVAPGRVLTVYYQAPSQRPPPCMRPPDPARAKPGIQATTWTVR